MEIALIVIAACLVSGLNTACFILGIFFERKREKKTTAVFDEATEKTIREAAEWAHF